MKTMPSRYHRASSGFTLVELAIVLMIIGLLIGGILRGQELYQNAVLNSVIKHAASYTGATTTFMDVYGSKPGEFPLAATRLPGCTTANFCNSGLGDGTLGWQRMAFTMGGLQDIKANCSPAVCEYGNFWKHLALANMISGVDPSATKVEFGISHPVMSLGGFSVITSDPRMAPPAANGFPFGSVVLRLHMRRSEDELTGSAGALLRGALTAKQAAYIDDKIDDGIPISGNVRARPGLGTGGNPVSNPGCEGNTYTSANGEVQGCILGITLLP